jgi:hypothetical protein
MVPNFSTNRPVLSHGIRYQDVSILYCVEICVKLLKNSVQQSDLDLRSEHPEALSSRSSCCDGRLEPGLLQHCREERSVYAQKAERVVSADLRS